MKAHLVNTRRLLLALVVLAALASACNASVSVGGPAKISQKDVQTQTAGQLSQAGQPLPIITCPDGLVAKVGSTMDCVLTVEGDIAKYGVHLNVDSITGTTAHWNIEVGKVPLGDKAAFCTANGKIDAATSKAASPNDLAAIFKANQSTLDDFKKTAPPDIRPDAEKLVAAATAAAASGDGSAFADQALQASGRNVDTYCGQSADGSPATTSTTAKAP